MKRTLVLLASIGLAACGSEKTVVKEVPVVVPPEDQGPDDSGESDGNVPAAFSKAFLTGEQALSVNEGGSLAIDLGLQNPDDDNLEFSFLSEELDSLVWDAEAERLRFSPDYTCLLYTSPSPRDRQKSRMPSSA